MRSGLIALIGAMLIAACSEAPPNPFPQSARATFNASCPADNPVCTCTWDRLTRTMTYEDYDAALEQFRETGHMDPRITRARTHCLEQHRPS